MAGHGLAVDLASGVGEVLSRKGRTAPPTVSRPYAGMWDLPIHAVKVLALPCCQTFSNTHMDRSLQPPLMDRP